MRFYMYTCSDDVGLHTITGWFFHMCNFTLYSVLQSKYSQAQTITTICSQTHFRRIFLWILNIGWIRRSMVTIPFVTFVKIELVYMLMECRSLECYTSTPYGAASAARRQLNPCYIYFLQSKMKHIVRLYMDCEWF